MLMGVITSIRKASPYMLCNKNVSHAIPLNPKPETKWPCNLNSTTLLVGTTERESVSGVVRNVGEVDSHYASSTTCCEKACAKLVAASMPATMDAAMKL